MLGPPASLLPPLATPGAQTLDPDPHAQKVRASDVLFSMHPGAPVPTPAYGCRRIARMKGDRADVRSAAPAEGSKGQWQHEGIPVSDFMIKS